MKPKIWTARELNIARIENRIPPNKQFISLNELENIMVREDDPVKRNQKIWKLIQQSEKFKGKLKIGDFAR